MHRLTYIQIKISFLCVNRCLCVRVCVPSAHRFNHFNPIHLPGMRLPEVRQTEPLEKKFPRLSSLAIDIMKVGECVYDCMCVSVCQRKKEREKEEAEDVTIVAMVTYLCEPWLVTFHGIFMGDDKSNGKKIRWSNWHLGSIDAPRRENTLPAADRTDQGENLFEWYCDKCETAAPYCD